MADWAEKLTDARLAQAAKRCNLGAGLALVATIGMFVAGIWLDWRWLPTALIPLAVLVQQGARAQALQWAADRRKDRTP